MSRGQFFSAVFLSVLLLISALTIVWVQYENRVAFQQWRALQEEHDRLSEQWRLLQLAMATRAAPVRVESSAVKKLSLRRPNADEIVVIQGRVY